MIVISSDYEVERDKYQWILHHWTDGRDKYGNAKRVCHDTYHATLLQVCKLVLDQRAGDADSLSDVIQKIEATHVALQASLSGSEHALRNKESTT